MVNFIVCIKWLSKYKENKNNKIPTMLRKNIYNLIDKHCSVDDKYALLRHNNKFVIKQSNDNSN